MKTEDDPFAGLNLSDAPPPRELGARIVSQCTRDLGPARGWSQTARWAITLATVVSTSAVLSLLRFNGSTDQRRTLTLAFLWTLGIVVGSVFVLLRPPGRRPSSATQKTLLALGLASFLAYLGSLVERVSGLGAALSQPTYACALYALATSSVTVVLLMLPWRRTDPLSPSLTGAFLGLCGGLAAGLAVAMGCPNHEAWHLILGHGLALTFIVPAAGWLGQRWLSP